MLVPSTSFAGAWTTWHKVHVLYTQNNGNVLMRLKTDNNHINPDGCIAKNYLVLHPDNKAYDEIYKMALTAKASGKNFRVFLAGCHGDWPKIAHSMIW
jgi:hypothetical protein